MSQFPINVYCTLRHPPEPDFPHKLVGHRDRSDPELVPHLGGFINFLGQKAGGKMTVTLYHVLRHIERVRHQFSLEVEEAGLEPLAHWALAANALLFFSDSSVRDPFGGVLVSPDGKTSDDYSRIPFPKDGWERKTRSEEQLKARGIPLPPNPPVVAEGEVELRTTAELEARVAAVAAVARRGRGGPKEDVSGLSLSPIEEKFLAFDEPDPDEMFEASWRTESQFLFEWALGMRPSLPWPDQVADLDPPLQAGGQLRSVAEILDQLDLHYRLHWVLRKAVQEKRDPPAGLNLSVVMERHYSLNWLTRFEDAEWDDVDMPT